jgi:hypothetical protein
MLKRVSCELWNPEVRCGKTPPGFYHPEAVSIVFDKEPETY